MKLHFTDQGEGPPLVVLHGLFGSARNWGTLAKSLARTRRVIAADLRNHGRSPWDARMDYTAMAEDLLELIAGEGLDRPAVLGHSMGGKAAMTAALTAPERIGALVVADIAPVSYAHSHEAYIDALAGLDLPAFARRAEADLALSASVPEAALRDFLLSNLSFGDGGPRWTVNLFALGANMPALTGFPFAPGQAHYEGPALFLRGGASPYVRAEHEPAIRQFFPSAAIETVEGAGHWLHAERPAEFLDAVEGFLAGL